MSHKILNPVYRIVVTDGPDDTSLQFHLNTAISQCPIKLFNFPIPDYELTDLSQVGNIRKRLVRGIEYLPGTTQVCIQPYETQVRIGEAFRWDENDLLEEVILVLKECFNSPKDVQVVYKNTQTTKALTAFG